MRRPDRQRRAMFAALRARAGRVGKRHPGVKASLRRTALVAAGTGAVLAASRGQGVRAARSLRRLQALRQSRAMLRAVPAEGRGLLAFRDAVSRDITRTKRHALRQAERALNLRRGAYAAGGLGTVWASVPAFEARADARERRQAQSLRAPVVIVRRRRGGR